jgi:hypothetical protein
MNTRPKGSVRLVMLLLGFGLFACGGPQEAVDQTTHSSESWDPCGNLPGLALDLEAAASAPALIGQEDSPTLGELGPEGAKALAAQLQPQGTFCEAAPPAAFQPILEKAQQLADQGDKAGARMLLESLLDIGSLPGGGYLLSVRIQTPGQARSFIRGLLVAAGLDLALGGDGKDFIDQANTTFSEMANGELNSASFEETLRLADEAQRLGQDDIAQRALERAQEIAAEGLDAAIEDLDPCLSNPQDLHDEITKLLLAFQTASLLGVPDTYGPGQSRYDATWSQATKALKALGGETPDECKGFSFDFAQPVSDGLMMQGSVHACGDIRGPWTGTFSLSGTTEGENVHTSGQIAFTIPQGDDTVEAQIPTTGSLCDEDGCCDVTDSLLLRFTLQGKSNADVLLSSDYNGTLVCPPDSEGNPGYNGPWVTVFSEGLKFEVPLKPYKECD